MARYRIPSLVRNLLTDDRDAADWLTFSVLVFAVFVLAVVMP